MRVAINGFGRIGRLVYRAILESKRKDIEVVGINDLGPASTNAHLLKYDSVHGVYPGEIKATEDTIDAGQGPVKISAERDPAKLPWKALGVDIALECTGIFTNKAKAGLHLEAGAKRVLISAPADDADATIVYGVNEGILTKDMTVVSAASCTTNCLAPMAKVLHDNFGILRGYMVTIHAYTGDQGTVDHLHKDLRRARAAAVSAIPTSTGAARSVGLVMPELKGKLDGTAIRIPTPNVSIVSLDVNLSKAVTKDDVNAAMKAASQGAMKGVLDYNTAPLVSADFNHSPASCVFDATQTAVVDGGNMLRVMGWYDNEWGFSNRMLDTAAIMGRL